MSYFVANLLRLCFMDQLDQFRKNKIIPEELEVPILKALSYYPELKETKIKFRYKKGVGKSIMLAQPIIETLPFPAQKRGYVIKFRRSIDFEIFSKKVYELPEDILVGWFGHELGHIVDYLNRSSLQLIKFGLLYWLSSNFKVRVEKTADRKAVEHGLGDEIIKTKNYILDNAYMPEEYKERIKTFYPSPEEIAELVEKLEVRKKPGRRRIS